MWRSRSGLGIGRVAASAALILTAFTSFGAALVVDATSAHALSCTESWTGEGGNDLWSNSGNWTGDNSVPGAGDVVCIGNETTGTTPYSVSLTSNTGVAALELGGSTASTLTLSSATLTLGSAANGGSEVFSNGALDVDSTTSASELANYNTSTALTIDSGGQLNTSGSAGTDYLGEYGTIVNNGTMTIGSVSQTQFWSGVAVTNNGTINVSTGDLLDADSTTFTNSSTGTIGNSGTVNLDTDFIDRGAETGTALDISSGATFDDDTSAGGGSFTATSVNFTLTGTGTSPGIAANQTLDVVNSTGTVAVSMSDNGIVNVDAATSASELPNYSTSVVFTIDPGGQLDTSGSAGVDYLGEYGKIVNNGTMTIGSVSQTQFWSTVAVTNNATLNVSTGDLLDADSTTFTNSSTGTIANSGTLNLNATDFIDRGAETGTAVNISSGTTFDDDTSAGGGSFTATSVNFTLTGTGTSPGIAADQTLDVVNSGGTVAVSMSDNGIVNVDAATSASELPNGSTSVVFTIDPGGQLDTSGGAGVDYLGEYGKIVNNGTMTIGSVTQTQFWSGVAVTNNATLNVSSGDLLDADSTTFTNSSTGTIANSGTLNLNGTDFIDRGAETGSAVDISSGATFDDDTSAGGGSFTATSVNFDLTGTGTSPGIAAGQTLDVVNSTGTIMANMVDNGIVNVDAATSASELPNNSTGITFTVGSGGQLNTLGSAGVDYLGEYGNIVNNGTMTISGTTDQFWSTVAVTNNGKMTVAPGSTITVGHTFTQGRFGTTAVTSNTTAPSKSVITGGTDTFDGTLDVTTIGTPATYSPFTSASGNTGEFGTLNYNGVDYSTAYSSSAVTLTPSSTSYEDASLTPSSTSVGATGVAYTINLQGQAITAGTTFTITSPSGTTFPTYSSNCYSVTLEDVTTSTSYTCMDGTPSGGGTTLTFTTPTGMTTIPATDTAQIQILDVTNGASPGPYSLTISYGSDSVLLGYTLTPSTSVSNAAITASSTSDGASDVVYTTTFTATNGLTASAGESTFSTITLTFPGTYTPPTYPISGNCNNVVIYDLTADTSETCTIAAPSTNGQSITYGVPITINPGDQVKVVWTGVTNPASSAGTQTFTLVTSADPTPVDLSVDLTSPTSVANASVTAVSSTSEDASEVAYSTTFDSSSSTTLVGGYSTITLTLPSGYAAPTYTSNCNVVTIDDVTTSATETCSSTTPTISGQSIIYAVPPSVTINPGDTVEMTWYGITNPAGVTNPENFQISTSGDPTKTTMGTNLGTSETGVTGLSLSPSNEMAGATGVSYTAGFTTQNSLVDDAGNASGNSSVISVTFPTGTVLPSFTSPCSQVTLDDITTSTDYTCTSTTPTVSNGLTVNYPTPTNIAAGNQLSLVINGLTNPPSSDATCSGSQSASLVTTSDPASESASYAIDSAPDAPTLGTLTAGSGQVTVPWTAPSCTNGSTISGYTVVWGTSESNLTLGSASVSSSTFTHTVTGLTNGMPYYFAVFATSNLGNGADSLVASATPEASASATGLTPTSGPVGTSATITATGFAATSALTVKVDGTIATITAGATTNGSGSSTVTFNVPAVPNGAQSVVVTDASSNTATSATNFTVTASATGLTPTSGPVGTSATITAQGFAATSALTVKVDGTIATITAGATTNASGSSTVTFNVPAVPNGAQSVVVSDASSNTATSATNFTVGTSATGLTPTSGPVGTSATITAQGFAATSALTVKVGGTIATITAGATTGTNGSSTVTFNVPAVPNGAQSVVVTDASSNTATSATNFTVGTSATGLAPTSGPVGTSATITAQGFAAGSALTVKVGGTIATITGGATTGTNGSSTVTFTVPAVPNGAQSVVVSDASSNTATSATNFTVTASATGLAPTSGPVGTSVTITAEGFAAGSALTVKVGGTSATITGGATTGTNGSSTVTFTVPAVPHGAQSVVVTDASSNTATSATNFTVGASATGLAPTSGPVGTSATITAQGFAAGSALTVKVDGASATITGGATTGTNGSSTVTFTVPAVPNGAQSVVVTDASSNTATSATDFTVGASATGLTPTSGPVGTSATITAQGFAATSALTVKVGGTIAAITAGATTNASGSSTVTFTVPSVSTGAQSVVVTDASSNTATSATDFTVTNASATGLTPTSGPVGTSATITATGFADSSALTVKVDGTIAAITAGATTNGSGSSTVTFTVPAVPNGAQSVVVTDASANTAASATNFTVTASATGLTPTSGPVGTSATITAQGFAATSALTVKVDGTIATITAGATTNASGSSTVTFNVPAVPNGAQSVVVSDASSNTATSATNFTVGTSATGLTPTSGPVGTSATITAQGFAATSALTVKVDGTIATITGGATTGTNGSSTVTFNVPAVPNGAQSVVVSDASSNTATSATNFIVGTSATGLTPTSGPVGTSATITAQGFAATSGLTVEVGGASATITSGGTTNGSGSSTVTFNVPAVPHGARSVVVTDASSNTATSATNFTVTASATGLTPTSGPVGTSATITAQGFAATSGLTVEVGGASATITGGATTNANGSSTVTFTVPAVPNGAQSVVVTDASSNTATSATNFTVGTSATGLTPTSGPVGTSATITAQGFAATSALTVKVDGTIAAITAGATTNASGSSTVTFTVPSVSTGAQSVVVTDASSNTATSATDFTVTPTVTATATGLTPTSGPVGTSATITAQGFAATSGLTVKVDGVSATITAGATTNGSGSSTVTFNVPAVPNGAQSVVVTDASSNTATSATDFTVTASATGLAPTSGPVGTSASITAQGFAAGSALTVKVGGTSATITGGATTGTNGSSTVTFTVPSVSTGAQSVVVTDASSNTATSATNFTVTTASANNLRIQLSSPGLISGVGGLYLVTVTNLAATPTTGTLTITDVLPSGVSYIGGLVYPPGFHCSATAGTVTCTTTTAIAAHATVDLLGVVGVSARAGTSITDTVTLTPVGTPASNYTATVKTTVSAR